MSGSACTNGCHWVTFQVHRFPIGHFKLRCNFSDGSSAGPFRIKISHHKQTFASGYCYVSKPYRVSVTINGITSNSVAG